MATKLESCPCCGGEAKLKAVDYVGQQEDATTYQVKCLRCGLSTETYRNAKEAIIAWNMRSKTDEDLSAENTKLKTIIDRLQAEISGAGLKHGDLAEKNAELKEENKILRAQMDVVRMIFKGGGGT